MSEQLLMYVGTYTRSGSEGIYVYRIDPSSGALELASTASGVTNPSFLAIHPSGRFLYSVSEARGQDGKPAGGVAAFAIAPGTGALTLLNQQSSGGVGPCHVDVDKTGRYLFVANYASGSVAMLPIQPDGSLAPASDFHQHEGHSVDRRRQEGPHAHSINVDPTNGYALVPDLGLDKVLVYKLDLENGKLIPAEEPFVQLIAGSGPRHLAFHPQRNYVFVITEMGNTIMGYLYYPDRGALKGILMMPTLPRGWEGESYCAHVAVSASGKFLYGSNRGHDSIAVFSIDVGKGLLDIVDHTSTQGSYPRHFCLHPADTFLWAANQNSDTIVAFSIDQGTGRLTPTGHVTNVPMPVCLKILNMPE